MPRPRRIQDPDVLTRAMLVFWREGYAGASVRGLEQATGLKASSLYHRFGSKDGLHAAALEHYLEKVVQGRIERYLGDVDPIRGLRRFLETCYDYVDPEAGRPPMACLLANTALETGLARPPQAAAVRRGLGMLERAFAAALERARLQGRLAVDADVTRLASVLLLGMQGLLVCSRVDPDRGSLQRGTEALLAALPLVHPPAYREFP